jgi:flagellar biosynthesis protein FlhF
MNMQTRQFRAKSMTEALRETRRVMGADALIVATRTLDSAAGLVEVTAVAPRESRAAKGPNAQAEESSRRTDDVAGPPPWEKSIDPLREDLVALRRMVLELRRVTDEAILPGFDDLRTLILESSQEQEAGRMLGPLYTSLVDRGVRPDIARNLLRGVELKLGLKNVDRRDWLALAHGITRELIAEQLVLAGPMVPGDGARVFAFLGPSGVGKTTTLAKIASRMALSEGLNVVVVTTDTYRVGSIEQSRRYAELIGVPLVVADRPETMAAAMRSYAGADAILIDTPGRAFENEEVRHALLEVMRAVGEPVEGYLLVAATFSAAQHEAIFRSFAELNPAKVIATKIDESRQPGSLINIHSMCPMPIAYLTNGHRVPEDIELARAGRIVQLVLGPTD